MIDLSHGEFRALVAKAFRGAGYSWGLTEEAAFSAGFLAEAGFPAAEAVVRLLSTVDGRPVATGMPDRSWQGQSGPLCPICVGTSLADQGGCEALAIGPTVEPLFIAPFLAVVATEATSASASSAPDSTVGFVMTWDGGQCEVGVGGMVMSGTAPSEPVAIGISRCQVDAGPQSPVSRVRLPPEVFAELERFAHRVYAPATEASRAAGAGAGTSDND